MAHTRLGRQCLWRKGVLRTNFFFAVLSFDMPFYVRMIPWLCCVVLVSCGMVLSGYFPGDLLGTEADDYVFYSIRLE